MEYSQSNRQTAILTVAAIAFILALLSLSTLPVRGENLLRDTCTQFRVPENIRQDTYLDADRGLFLVSWTEEGEGKQAVLPYEPATEFADCSANAKTLLRRAQIIHDKTIRAECNHLQAILDGKRDPQTKGGVVPNVAAALIEAEKYCDLTY